MKKPRYHLVRCLLWCSTWTLRYRLLPRVKLPTWEELEDYFNHQSPRPPPAMVDELRAEYQRLISGSRLSYQELADLLDRYLQDA